MKTSQQIISDLSGQGYKKTRLREALVNYLWLLKKPLDAIAIQAFLLKKKLPSIKSTVYREIDFLLEHKIIVEINFGDGKKHYEIAGLPHHHHLVCNKCRNIEDIFIEQDLETIERQIEKEKSFVINQHSLEFFGLCKNCI
jgi:Fur family ferric uptake transcriptional regulator